MSAVKTSSKSKKSSADSEATSALGKARRHWDSFIQSVERDHPDAIIEWKRYSTGERLIIRDKRRNLAYLKPEQNRFIVSFAFGDAALKAAEQAKLPAPLIRSIQEAPQYPEGRPVRNTVDSAASLSIAKKLLAIKAAH